MRGFLGLRSTAWKQTAIVGGLGGGPLPKAAVGTRMVLCKTRSLMLKGGRELCTLEQEENKAGMAPELLGSSGVGRRLMAE